MKAPSVIPINPGSRQGSPGAERTFRYPFPNSANQGKKFNPGGDNVGAIATASVQKGPGHLREVHERPARRAGVTTGSGLLRRHAVRDRLRPAQSPTPRTMSLAHPTDRTLYNYFQEVSYGNIDVITLNMPSDLGWKNAGHPFQSTAAWRMGCTTMDFGPYPNNAQGMVIDAVRAVDPFVDFSRVHRRRGDPESLRRARGHRGGMEHRPAADLVAQLEHRIWDRLSGWHAR